LFIDNSTTCSELSRLLATGHRHTVLTDSLSVLLELSGKPGIELVLLGGALDRDGNTFDGLLAVESARRVQVDRCFFSCRGFSIDAINNAGMIGCQVKQIMIQNSGRCFLLADSTKYGWGGIIRLCDWRDVDVLISDDGLAEDVALAIGRSGVEVRRASSAGERS
jgi:DeoR/GlpR family transcriptional regulator of sugar metabolism